MSHAAKATSALNAIKRAGTTYTLARTTVTASGSEPWNKSSSSSASQTANGILDDFRAFERDGQIVRERDRRYLIAASGLSPGPAPGDELTDGSDTLRVESVETIRSGNVDVIHFLHTRI